MTDRLYLKDSYLGEFDALVVFSEAGRASLDRTAFFAKSGGQPSDKGTISWQEGSVKVVESEIVGDDVVHLLDGGPPPMNSNVRGVVDWPRRHRIMRLHTALHILSGLAYKLYGAKITGSQIHEERARMDLALESFDREILVALEREANRLVGEARDVYVRFVPRADFMASPHLRRVDERLYPQADVYRVVDIAGFDAQADGGTHVKKTSEVGQIKIVKAENKGRMNRRIEITVA